LRGIASRFASITGSPCLRPLELEKKPYASLLIKIEKRTIEMQKEIKFLPSLEKSIFSRIARRKFQKT